MKRYLKIWTILFIFSIFPIIISYLFNQTGSKAESSRLKGNEAAHFKTSVEEKQLYSPNHTKETGDKVIYLTFDDGPSRYTRDILKTLQLKNAHATFFLLKGNIDKNPSILEEMVNQGHSVGCHGVSHRVDIFYSSPKVAVHEMKECQRDIYDYSRVYSPLIRVPFGSYPHLSPAIKKELLASGFIYWDWTIDSEDWTNNHPEQVLKNVKSQLKLAVKKGYTPVVLLHDKEVTAKTLPQLLSYLQASGYKMEAITISKKPVQFKWK
ncbi:polysaccharide deacetylase family protein [Schinkia sp. CFF1]